MQSKEMINGFLTWTSFICSMDEHRQILAPHEDTHHVCSRNLDSPGNYFLRGCMSQKLGSGDLGRSTGKLCFEKSLKTRVSHHSRCKLILSTTPNESEYVQVVLSSILLLSTFVKVGTMHSRAEASNVWESVFPQEKCFKAFNSNSSSNLTYEMSEFLGAKLLSVERVYASPWIRKYTWVRKQAHFQIG